MHNLLFCQSFPSSILISLQTHDLISSVTTAAWFRIVKSFRLVVTDQIQKIAHVVKKPKRRPFLSMFVVKIIFYCRIHLEATRVLKNIQSFMEVKLYALLGNYDRRTDRPSDQPTD